MAKVTIVGNALVVTSTLKFEDIIKVAKYRPSALILKDEEGKNDVFAIDVTDEFGRLTSKGALFDGETHDEDGFATITIAGQLGGTNEEIKEFVADELGGALQMLAKLEASLPAVITEINDAKTAVMESIQFS